MIISLLQSILPYLTVVMIGLCILLLVTTNIIRAVNTIVRNPGTSTLPTTERFFACAAKLSVIALVLLILADLIVFFP